MRLLLLGGTKFLGRHLVLAAQARNHELTMFNRGTSYPGLFPEVEQLIGDRDGNLRLLEGRRFDAVIDTSGYVPRIVRQSLTLLQDQVDHYTFISSISAYADFGGEAIDEESETAKLEDPLTEEVSHHYGALKAACEQEVAGVFGDRSLNIRPGLIVGPYDPTDRFTYWPARYAEGGEVLVPGQPERPVQFIDARDLAEWTIRMVEARQAGVYNATGPSAKLTMGELVPALEQTAGKPVHSKWVDEAFLHEQQVGEWVELPLWVSERMNWPQFMNVSNARAIQAGLTFRPIEQTILDTLSWHRSREPYTPWKAGLTRKREQALLNAYNAYRAY